MAMKKLLTVATAALVAANVFADPTYSYDDADRLNYAVSVPSGETVEISSGAISLLNANSVTNFIKRGDGTLVVGSVLDSYTGSVCVEDGIYRMAPSKTDNTACGARSGGGVIVVSDGATLSTKPTVANASLSGKKILFGGHGHNGIGALYMEPGTTVDQDSATFGNCFEMTSDALVRNASVKWFRFSSVWKTMNMNGHALTFSNSGDTSKQVSVGFANESSGSDYDITNPGPIYCIEGGIRCPQNYWHTLAGSGNTLTISNNAALCFNGQAASATRTLIMASGSRFYLNNSNVGNAWYNNYGGPVRLDGMIDIDSPVATYNMYLSGRILCGGLRICRPAVLQLYYRWGANNLDKGVVVANRGTVNIWYKDCLNASCGPLVVTNGCVNIKAGSDNYAEWATRNVLSLPTAVMHGNSSVTNGYGWWKGSLTKTGAGNLIYESWIGAPELILKGGSFIMPKTAYSGPLSNVPILPVFTNLTATGGTEIDFGGNSYSVKNLAGATSLVDCPAFTVDGQWTISADDAIAGHPLETAGSIAFGAGSSVAFAQPSEPVRNERTYTVLTAAAGVTGFVPGTVAKNWRTSLSGDGKSVLLTHVGPGFILTFK